MEAYTEGQVITADSAVAYTKISKSRMHGLKSIQGNLNAPIVSEISFYAQKKFSMGVKSKGAYIRFTPHLSRYQIKIAGILIE